MWHLTFSLSTLVVCQLLLPPSLCHGAAAVFSDSLVYINMLAYIYICPHAHTWLFKKTTIQCFFFSFLCCTYIHIIIPSMCESVCLYFFSRRGKRNNVLIHFAKHRNNHRHYHQHSHQLRLQYFSMKRTKAKRQNVKYQKIDFENSKPQKDKTYVCLINVH